MILVNDQPFDTTASSSDETAGATPAAADAITSPADGSVPVAVDEPPAVSPAPARSHTRIAALSIAAAVLLTAGAGAGAWAATAAAGSGATTTAIGGIGGSSTGGSTSGGTGASDGTGTSGGTQGFGQQGFGGQGSQGFGGQGFGPGASGGSSTGSATVDSTEADASQIVGVVTIVSELGYANGESAGTGIVLTSSGRILTNNHVIDGATAVKVTVESTGTTYTADVVGTNATQDVAVLQLQGASGLATATLASSQPAEGDDVTAVGNAEGTGTLTAAEGTVTDLGEQITTQSEGTASGETLNGLIETSADVVSGDSGGPLKNSSGQVVGITTAASSGGSDITGYAIPITTALSVAEQILAGQETDEITIGLPAFLGVSLSDSTSGAVVAGALDGTPAAKAGIAEGDTITAIDGTAVGSADALSTAIGTHEPGDSVKVAWTDSTGTSHAATVVLIDGPAD